MKWPVLVASILMVTSPIFLQSCGQSNSSDDAETFSGPSIAGSSYSGAYFTTVPKDSSNETASLYWYDFASGKVSRISSQSGRDPVAIATNSGKKLHFLTRSQLNYQSYDVSSGSATDGKSGTLTGLTSGDPTGWYESSTTELVLANSHDQSIRVFDPTTNYLGSKLSTTNVDLSDIGGLVAPTNVNAVSSNVWVFTSSVNVNSSAPTAAGYGHALSLQKADSWTISKNKTLTISHPVFSYALSSGSLRVTGLCKSSYGTSCKQGSVDVNATTGAVSRVTDLASLNYEYFATITSAGDESTVYAHVKSKADSTHKIIKINLTKGTAEEVVSLADDSLYLMYYDSSSQRLLVGNQDGGDGVLEVYKSSSLEGRIKLKAIPRSLTVIK